MTEKELINQIKQLKQIKPQKDWVFSCKNRILELEEKTYRGRASVFSLFARPAYIASAVLILLIVSMAGFFLLMRPIENEILVEPEPVPTEEVILALENLEIEIDRTIEALKEIKKPHQVLEARNVVVPTIKVARDVITEVKKTEAKEQGKILAVKVDELEKTLDERMASTARNLIQYLETRTLTEDQQEILEKARQSYAQGNYIEALINSLLVSQLIR